MCGICGVLTLSGDTGERRELNRMLESLRHRGPDGVDAIRMGPMTMGHTRLSIRGGSEARQPIVFPDGRSLLSYNGEIYNCDELLDEMGLPRDWSRSDSVVLARWLARDGALADLNGMFAFAWWRDDRRELWLVRDRFGIKPLYYLARPGYVAFASEAQAFRVLDDWRPQPDLEMIWEYLVATPPAGARTLWRDIQAVPPGAAVCVKADTGEVSLSRFGDRMPGRGERELTADVLGRVLESVVRRQMISDRPVGLTVSGGLDSMVIAATVAKLGANLPAFAVDWRESHDLSVPFVHGSDGRYARLGTDALGLPFTLVELEPELDEATITSVIAKKNLPLSHTTELAIDRLMETIARSCRVVLTGEGADELWQGYSFFARRPERTVPWAGLALADLGRVLRAEVLERFGVRERLAESGRAYERMSLQEALFAGFLPYLLERLDRLGMAHSIEARVPYLDHELALQCDLTAPEPPDPLGKTTLRQLGRRLLPGAIAERPKSAFPPSLGNKSARSMLAILGRRLGSGRCRIAGWLRPDAQDRLQQGLDGFSGQLLAWRLLNLDLWMEWLDGPSGASSSGPERTV